MEKLESEVWLPVIGYEGLYKVSNFGKVKSIDRVGTGSNGKSRNLKGVNLSICIDSKGYCIVNLSKEGKVIMHRVHRLVASRFVPNPHSYDIVNHKDFDRTNCHYKNLEWTTTQGNIKYSTDAGRTVQAMNRRFNYNQIVEIRELAKTNVSSRKIAKIFNVSKVTILNIINHKIYKEQ